jgi:hypothetical protein
MELFDHDNVMKWVKTLSRVPWWGRLLILLILFICGGVWWFMKSESGPNAGRGGDIMAPRARGRLVHLERPGLPDLSSFL